MRINLADIHHLSNTNWSLSAKTEGVARHGPIQAGDSGVMPPPDGRCTALVTRLHQLAKCAAPPP